MDHILQDGDFALNASGYPETATGTRALLQRAELRLRIPRCSFDYDDLLGSRLPAMRGMNEEWALALAREALAPLPEVQAAAVQVEAECVRVEVLIDGGRYEIEVERNGEL